jgi:uncharacterized protein YnzC (UPF0291/DUF896 family)
MPTLQYNLDKEDYLAFQLQNASISELIKKKRKRAEILVPSVYVMLGLLLFWSDQTLAGGVFMAIAILLFFIYPVIVRNRYLKSFKGHVAETFKPDLENAGKLELGQEYICGSNGTIESKVQIDQIERIDETGKHIFIHVSQGMGFIIPKEKVVNLEEAYTWLDELENKLGVKRGVNLEWKWK